MISSDAGEYKKTKNPQQFCGVVNSWFTKSWPDWGLKEMLYLNSLGPDYGEVWD